MTPYEMATLALTVLGPTGAAFFWLNRRLMDLHREVGRLEGRVDVGLHVPVSLEEILPLLADRSKEDSP